MFYVDIIFNHTIKLLKYKYMLLFRMTFGVSFILSRVIILLELTKGYPDLRCHF